MAHFASLLPQHPQRTLLHGEIHARPPETITAPQTIAHIVMLADEVQRNASHAHLVALLQSQRHTKPDIPPDAIHWRVTLGALHIRWALHTEFVSWTFMLNATDAPQHNPEHPPSTALQAVPPEWLARLPGQCLSALHLWVVSEQPLGAPRWLYADSLVASYIGGKGEAGQGAVYTDFALHSDGFSRILLAAGTLTPRRLGRMVQRLLDVETYRMAALLGLPAARQASAALACAEHELADLAAAIRNVDHNDEALLDRLTQLAGQVEGQYAATHARFSASNAYFELVDRRIRDLGETHLAGAQTIGQFMERRLSPARSTCAWAQRRQNALSQRVARMSSLLRTRVEIAQQHSSAALLASMNRRAALQLRLQATVEGLSAVAMTSYVVGLVHYLAKGAQMLGWPFSADATAASALPFVGAGVWWGLRRLHQRMLSVGQRGEL